MSEERLGIAADAARLGLWRCDFRSGSMFWDELCKEHLGFPPDAEVTFNIFFKQLPPEDCGPTREALKVSIAEHKTFDRECRTVACGGRDRWIRVIGHRCYDDSGECYRLDGVTIDVTDRKLGETAQREADRRRDEFLAILAHEVRNPLAAINNAVQLSLLSAREEELTWSKDVIARQAKNLARLLDDMLDVSRMTRDMIQLQKEQIDLAPVIARAVERVRPLIEQKKHNLTLSIAHG
jgi:nitrogen-specific signal transduction histidine kinase